jgi:cytochrome b6-f complex iron-sulfur subunit
MSESRPTRRHFLNLFLGSTLLAWLGTVLYPMLRYLKPLPGAGPGGPLALLAEELERLRKDKFVIVFEDPSQKVRALAARCTHEGCTVKYLPEESFISCACHNARFDLDGRVLAGPPPRPLKQFEAQRGDDEGVVVTTREA